MKLIGKAIDQKPTGEIGAIVSAVAFAMWKDRRNQNIMISKQHNKSILLIRTNIRSLEKSKYLKVDIKLHVGANYKRKTRGCLPIFKCIGILNKRTFDLYQTFLY